MGAPRSCPPRRGLSCIAPVRRPRAHPVPRRQQMHIPALLYRPPYALGQKQRKQHGNGAQADEVEHALPAPHGLYRKEKQRAEDGAFHGAYPPHQHHEDHVGRPLHAEIGLGLKADGRGEPQAAGQGAAKRRQHEHQPLDGDHAHAERDGCHLVVTNRLRGRAHLAAQKQEDHPAQPRHRSESRPVGVGTPVVGRVLLQRNHRGARLALHQAVEVDAQVRQRGHYPHADGEFAALQPQHEGRQRHRCQRHQHGPHQQCGVWAQARVGQPHHGVGPEAKERLVANRHQPGVARQGVPHHGQDHVDEQRGEPVYRARLQPQRPQAEHGQQQHGGAGEGDGRARPALDDPWG